MRIISGKYQRLILNTPQDNLIRPTMDRAKEGLFNVINYRIVDSVFLDLFSGSGSIGIEALSRGAREVVFVDKSSAAVSLINSNLSKLGEVSVVKQLDACEFLKSDVRCYDYIFMDPPYDIELTDVLVLVNVIVERDLLRPGGEIFIELDQKFESSLFNVRYKKYGKSIFSILSVHDA